MLCCCFFLYLFLTILVRPVISKSTGPIFAKFSGLVEHTAVDDQFEISFFRFLNEPCHGNQILFVSVHGCRWTQAASGRISATQTDPLYLPGGANVHLYNAWWS